MDIDKLRAIPITTILGIQNTGRRITIRCPYHKERTASFNLYPDNSFHCFGCGKNGKGAIDFISFMGYSVGETLKELAKFY